MASKITFTLLLLLINSILLGQEKIKIITKGDERMIRNAARNVITTLSNEYNFFLKEDSQQRNDRLSELVTPGQEMIFTDYLSRSIENDFRVREIENLTDQETEINVEKYFSDLAENYGMRDNGEDRNQDKEVTIKLLDLKLCYVPLDSLFFVKAYFSIKYDGIAKNGFRFKPVNRVADLVILKENRWRAYIRGIRFLDNRDKANDYSKNVRIVEDQTDASLRFAEIVNVNTKKTVNRKPLLRAYQEGELWGLLIDEDSNKKILAEPQWCDVDEFSEDGLAAVCFEGDWGYINTEGYLTIPYQFAQAGTFKNGKATVLKNGQFKPIVIDKTGKEIK
jgi:hypothetical protein